MVHAIAHADPADLPALLLAVLIDLVKSISSIYPACVVLWFNHA